MPAVAGTFYPDDRQRLSALLSQLVPAEENPVPALAVLVPHAGYVYSGPVAGAAFASVAVPDQVVVLCFEHRMAEEQFAIWTRGAWRTPLGDAPIAEGLADAIVEGVTGLVVNPPGHVREHSGEVQIPFLQHRNPRVAIVPIALTCRLAAAPRLARFGEELGAVMEGREALVVASSDLNHYEADEPTRRKDATVIAPIRRLDPDGMIDAIERNDVSMCGYAPALAMIGYARARGAESARLVKYDTSATTSGDTDRVVGYAGMVVDRPLSDDPSVPVDRA